MATLPSENGISSVSQQYSFSGNVNITIPNVNVFQISTLLASISGANLFTVNSATAVSGGTFPLTLAISQQSAFNQSTILSASNVPPGIYTVTLNLTGGASTNYGEINVTAIPSTSSALVGKNSATNSSATISTTVPTLSGSNNAIYSSGVYGGIGSPSFLSPNGMVLLNSATVTFGGSVYSWTALGFTTAGSYSPSFTFTNIGVNIITAVSLTTTNSQVLDPNATVSVLQIS
jgi:hypothetical protein